MVRRALLSLLIPAAVWAQAPQYQPPPDVEWRKANIYSEGTRMAAEIFSLKANAGKKLPTILMAHGWGGAIPAMRRDAAAYAQAGFLAVAFDYRGWGDSDSRLILTGPAPKPGPNRRFTAEVQEVREVVDPLDFGVDWLNAMHWLQAEPQCDTNRIGLWGSSFSGGLVVWVAARDPRVKVIHSQVGAFDGRELSAAGAELGKTYEEATKRARGEIGYPEPRAKVIGNLQGAPIRARFLDYAPVEDIARVKNVAIQIVIAENEELFDNRNHGIKAYERYTGTKNLVTVPGIKHYGIYYEAYAQAHKLSQDWYMKYLMK